MVEEDQPKPFEVTRKDEDTLLVTLRGSWCYGKGLQQTDSLKDALDSEPQPKKISFKFVDLEKWDSSLLSFLVQCRNLASSANIAFDKEGLPAGIRKLLELSQEVREEKIEPEKGRSFFYSVGKVSIDFVSDCVAILAFLGESFFGFMRLFGGRPQTRFRDFFYLVQQVGAEALPIIALISILVGLIMAFVGAVQLKKFGATIYIADLVGLAMTREMGAMMAGIIMCGRTGAAFAATIANMKVTEELDALKVTGISPVDFLVVPRIAALFFMMPLLTVFADFIGIGGGFLVGCGLMDLSFSEYYNETVSAITLTDFWIGVIKSLVFGILVAVTGCLRGMQSGTSSAAVGNAATSAVVTGITALIIADAVFAVLFDALGI